MGEGGALLLPGYRVLILDSIFKEPRQFRRSRHCEPTGRADARPMTGSAKQSILSRKERMDCFVAPLLAMTSRVRTPAARCARVVRDRFAQRARGMPGARCTRSLVRKV